MASATLLRNSSYQRANETAVKGWDSGIVHIRSSLEVFRVSSIRGLTRVCFLLSVCSLMAYVCFLYFLHY